MKNNTRNSKRYRLLGLLSLAGLLLAAGLIFFRWGTALGEPVPAQATAVPGVQTAQNPDELMAQQLREALNNKQLSAADRQSLETKLSAVQRLADQRQSPSQARGPKKPPIALAPMPAFIGPTPVVKEEILNGSEGLIHSWEAAVQNMWQGQRAGVYYQVLAGASGQDAAQGLVIVIQSSAGAGQNGRKNYPAPGKTGALHILSVDGTQVSLSTADGQKLYFDLSTRSFHP